MAIREGKWKCPSCQTVCRGAAQACEGCGANRPADVKFFLDEGAAAVSDAAQLAKAKAGADWVCEFCQNLSPATAKECSSCGAPPSGKVKAHGGVTPVAAPPPLPPKADPPKPPEPPKAPGKPLGMAGCLVLLLMLLCCVGGMFFFGRGHEAQATVQTALWQRTVEVEDEKPVEESAWDRAPSGARGVSKKREIRDYEKVQTGTRKATRDVKVQTGSKTVVVGHKDLGNGHFEDVTKEEPIYSTKQETYDEPVYEKRPIYGDKYYYTVDKWITVRTEKAQGDKDPTWPDLKLQGKEREGKKTESYKATFVLADGSKSFENRKLDEKQFRKYALGSQWKVEYNLAGAFKVLGPAGGGAAEPETLEAESSK